MTILPEISQLIMWVPTTLSHVKSYENGVLLIKYVCIVWTSSDQNIVLPTKYCAMLLFTLLPSLLITLWYELRKGDGKCVRDSSTKNSSKSDMSGHGIDIKTVAGTTAVAKQRRLHGGSYNILLILLIHLYHTNCC